MQVAFSHVLGSQDHCLSLDLSYGNQTCEICKLNKHVSTLGTFIMSKNDLSLRRQIVWTKNANFDV